MNPQVWSAVGSCATALVAIVAAGVAFWQAGEARKLRKEQAQPYIAVYMDISPVSQQVIDLVIKNFGHTVAYDVEVTFDPPLVRSSGSGNDTEPVHVPKTIKTLVPQQEWRCFWDSGISRNGVDLPDSHHAKAVFYEKPGRPPRARHELEYELDYEVWHGIEFMVQYGIHDAAKAIGEIRDHVKTWTESPNRGISVFTRNGDALDEKRGRERSESRRKSEEISRKVLPSDSSERQEISDQ
ncbi:hypothetical protein [Haloactinomyces albus]|uniref:Uncharacterized protein n=1 Tax=Haloactinomyces albus TaxID=1352928 RepID=A0AAE3ZAN7_9ACTN|nr:hypothetical protein [Haloactinomyces albus]MDR7300410.1 hypothetical protein [Haloactinomyces albus]